jgi:hypothetical protein
MRQCPWEEQTVRAQEHAKRRVGAWHHDLVWKTAGLRSWGTAVAAGALLPLLSAWSMPWYGVASSAGARMARDARGMAPLLAVSIGTLSWLAAVVIIAAILLGGMVLLNALVQRYGPQDVSWRGVLSYKAWGGRKPTRSLTVLSIGAARCLAASAPARSTSSNVAGSSMKAL